MQENLMPQRTLEYKREQDRQNSRLAIKDRYMVASTGNVLKDSLKMSKETGEAQWKII